MKDEETGSIWQQVSGKAIFGPLKGRGLTLVKYDELSFHQWIEEFPHGRVLKPSADVLISSQYAKKDWEQRMNRYPVITQHGGAFSDREIILGIKIGIISKAYPLSALMPQTPITDRIGDTPILLYMAEDGKSVRSFNRAVAGHQLDFYSQPGKNNALIDSITGSEWGFDGVARSGPLAGQRLTQIPVLKDYWFDWKNYHPDTLTFHR